MWEVSGGQNTGNSGEEKHWSNWAVNDTQLWEGTGCCGNTRAVTWRFLKREREWWWWDMWRNQRHLSENSRSIFLPAHKERRITHLRTTEWREEKMEVWGKNKNRSKQILSSWVKEVLDTPKQPRGMRATGPSSLSHRTKEGKSAQQPELKGQNKIQMFMVKTTWGPREEGNHSLQWQSHGSEVELETFSLL